MHEDKNESTPWIRYAQGTKPYILLLYHRHIIICKYTWIFENRVSKNINSFYYLVI